MKILLIAPDSKLPNLALMKLSAYHQAQGDTIGFHIPDPDIVYGSIIFHKNKGWAEQWKRMYPDSAVIVGGPGFDPKVKLPPVIEAWAPDQNLYSSKYSIGRVTSGCPRRCSFCMVSLLEPDGIRYIQSPAKIWKPGTILRLLDDNILAMESAFWEVNNFCLSQKVTIHFEYLDARLLTDSLAFGLAQMKHEYSCIHFSWDQTKDEPLIRRGIERMTNARVAPGRLTFLVYLHDEASIPDAIYRWKILRELGVTPFLMVNNEKRTPLLRKIARRGCRPMIWRYMTAEELFSDTPRKT